ncbi:MAG TPA: ArsR family transcriptional regulator [Ktedonobacteraceae bacterium]|nr:ArsR family transcriptional regulator [Ktedonobacteraceae bacterium]
MARLNWNHRFFASTRGRILTLLRREKRTVDDLASTLELTDNAVRAHLTTLERDGFVRQHGERRGNGKPSFVYELAPEAEYLFPKSYGQVLNELLQVLEERMSRAKLEEMLRIVGRRISTKWNMPEGDLRVRLEAAVEVLNELGGLAELTRENGEYCIRSYSCPLAAAVPGHPEVCSLAETLLTELIGVPVHEQCEHGEQVRCRFMVPEKV